jgi:hypothetical protein
MKAVAFRSKVNPDGTILLPKKVRRSVKGAEVRVILLWPESVDDASLWEQESIKTFLEGDGPHDALYDHRRELTTERLRMQSWKNRIPKFDFRNFSL